MRILTNVNWYRLSALIIIFYAVSCSKDVALDLDDRESYTVGFNFEPFKSSIISVSKSGITPNRSMLLSKTASTTAPPTSAHIQQGYLYYWSFNTESIRADQYSSDNYHITYNGGHSPATFVAGWKYDRYEAGRALSIKGLSELLFQMPLANALEVQKLGFDVGSSDTGPKAFDILYSQDGDTYHILSSANQFTNVKTASSKSSFEFYFDDIQLDLSKDLFVKIIPLEGERDSQGKAYGAQGGTFRIDNFRLVGLGEIMGGGTVRKLHYHIFDAATKELVVEGAEEFDGLAATNISLSLPLGDYMASFVSNVSEEELSVASSVAADAYFMANRFANHQAEIFGGLEPFTVASDQQQQVALDRYYSQVKFEFTDTDDLSHVAKIVLYREHEPNFYAPFNPAMRNPVLDQSELVIYPNFQTSSKELVFNQFIGQAEQPVDLAYRLELFDDQNILLNTVSVQAAIYNNVQLVFRGELLPEHRSVRGFTVIQNKEWGDAVRVDF